MTNRSLAECYVPTEEYTPEDGARAEADARWVVELAQVVIRPS